MRNGHGGFQKNQTLGRVVLVDPATQHVAGQSAIIPDGIFSAQGKLEAVLAILIAMANSLVTACS